VVVLFGVWPLRGGDLVMHLTVGRWIWEHGWVPITDPFSYITEGQPFIAHSWLAEIVFFLIERATGTVGFMLLRFALIIVALGCAVQTALALGAKPWAMVSLSPLVLGIMWGRLEFRPQLLTTTFLSLELWLLVTVYRGQRSWRWLWCLPPMCAIWINWHGGWPQGQLMLIVITGSVAAMEVRRRWLGGRSTSQLCSWQLGLVLGACGVALFANPYGIDLITFPRQMEASWIRANGPEWQSSLGAKGWWLVGGGRLVPIQPVLFAYLALLVGVLLVDLRRWRTGDLMPIAVMGLWLALSLWHLRKVSDATLLRSPFVAAALPATWWQTRQWPVWAGIGLLIGLTAMGLWFTLTIWAHPHSGWRWTHGEPVCAMAAVARLGLSGHAFTKGENSWLV
jgi:hypothetical protein